MPKVAKQETTGEVILQLDPAVILADDNTRFNLKEPRVEALTKSILEMGGVMEPIEVQPIDSDNGHRYRLTMGAYRLAAVLKLNATQNAGLTIPAIVRDPGVSKDRLKRQLTENVSRETMSPMDTAIAIDKMFKEGFSRTEIREVFSRPGGKKGNALTPASNAYINMIHSFLTLPKAIQEKIHDGRVGVAAAYELTKVPKDKQAEILQSAEDERLRAFEKEQREEARFLNAQEKHEAAQEKQSAAEKALADAVEAEKTALAKVDELTDKAKAAYQETLKKGTEKVKDAQKTFKAADIERADAVAEAEKLTKARKNIEEKQTKAKTLAAQKAQELANARAAKAAGKGGKKQEAVGPQDVKKAAAKAGAAQYVPLNLKEIRDAVNELALPGGNETVVEIGKLLQQMIGGVVTPKQCYEALQALVS